MHETPNPIFYATDKDRFDLMMSAKRKLTMDALRSIAVAKGFVLSPEDTRENVADFLSMMPHDYEDLEHLKQLSQSVSRSEKYTSEKLVGDISNDEIANAIRAYVDKEREGGTTDTLIVAPKKDGTTSLEVKYTELDHSKSTLSQRQDKIAEIEVIRNGSEITIRMPASEKTREIGKGIRDQILAAKALERQVIERSSLISADERTRFFTDLITKLEGFSLSGVTSVSVVHFGSEAKDVGDSEVEEDQDADEEADHEDASSEMLSVVKRAALDGENILASKEYLELKARGFYLSRVVWKSEVRSTQPDVVEFEAGFGTDDEDPVFKYSARGAFKFKGKGVTRTRRPISHDERANYMAILEKCAVSVYQAIVSERAAAHGPEPQEDGPEA